MLNTVWLIEDSLLRHWRRPFAVHHSESGESMGRRRLRHSLGTRVSRTTNVMGKRRKRKHVVVCCVTERLDRQTWFQVERWEHAELLWCAKWSQKRRWWGKWWWWRRDCPQFFTRNSQNNVSEFPSIARVRLRIALSRVCTPLLSSGKLRAEAFKLARVSAQHCVIGPGIQTRPWPTWIGQRIMTSKVEQIAMTHSYDYKKPLWNVSKNCGFTHYRVLHEKCN